MKRIIWVLLAILPLCLHAQYVVKHDVNEQFEYMTDYQWNKWNRGFVLNGEFIKNPIGINLNKVEKVHKALPFTIKNVGRQKIPYLFPKGGGRNMKINVCRSKDLIAMILPFMYRKSILKM